MTAAPPLGLGHRPRVLALLVLCLCLKVVAAGGSKKISSPKLRMSPSLVSRQRALMQSQSGSTCKQLSQIDFWGADISKKSKVGSAAACCSLCIAEPQCDRWSYSGELNTCWLKRSSGWIRKNHSKRVSGIVDRTAAAASNQPSLAATSSTGVFNRTDYSNVLGLSWLFYEAQRSGELPESGYRVPWRRSAHLTDTVPGGWYDAGDYLKANLPMASAVTFLSWGLLEFRDGYESAGQTQAALTNLRVAVDYLKRCHVGERRYVGQIGHPDVDHSYWGRADEQRTARPAYVYSESTPATDLLAKVSSALASSSLVWRIIADDKDGADDLLSHARELYSWAKSADKGLYSDSYTSATASIYKSSGWVDDMAWAAYWLYRATGNTTYLTDSVTYWRSQYWDVTAGWDNSGAATAVALTNLAEDGVTVPNASEMRDFTLNKFLKAWIDSDGYMSITKTSKGMSRPTWSAWGNLQLSTTAAFIALTHARHSKSAATRGDALQWARSQVDYALGSSGRSFVVGFGTKPPLFAHHAGASCPDRPNRCDWSSFDSEEPNPQVLFGALVAGPRGPDDNSYYDARSDYVTNEVSTGYNAGFTSALAGLIEFV